MNEENWKELLSIPAKLSGDFMESAHETPYLAVEKETAVIYGTLTREQLRAIVAWMDLESAQTVDR